MIMNVYIFNITNANEILQNTNIVPFLTEKGFVGFFFLFIIMHKFCSTDAFQPICFSVSVETSQQQQWRLRQKRIEAKLWRRWLLEANKINNSVASIAHKKIVFEYIFLVQFEWPNPIGLFGQKLRKI